MTVVKKNLKYPFKIPTNQLQSLGADLLPALGTVYFKISKFFPSFIDDTKQNQKEKNLDMNKSRTF